MSLDHMLGEICRYEGSSQIHGIMAEVMVKLQSDNCSQAPFLQSKTVFFCTFSEEFWLKWTHISTINTVMITYRILCIFQNMSMGEMFQYLTDSIVHQLCWTISFLLLQLVNICFTEKKQPWAHFSPTYLYTRFSYLKAFYITQFDKYLIFIPLAIANFCWCSFEIICLGSSIHSVAVWSTWAEKWSRKRLLIVWNLVIISL